MSVKRRAPTDPGWSIEHHPGYVNRRKRLHGTDAVLLSCVVAGTGRHHLGDRSVAEHGRSVSIVHYGQRHDIVTDAAGIEAYNVFLDPQRHPLPRLPQPLDAALAQIIPLHPAFSDDVTRLTRLEFDDFDQAARLLRGLHEEYRARATGWRQCGGNLLANLLIVLARRHLQVGSSVCGRRRHDDSMEALRRHLDAHLDEPYDLGALADRFGYERNYLCRKFKAYVGKSIGRYLDDRRIQQAMLMLQVGVPRIVDIAYAVGFQDLSRFNKIFKQRVGQTPSAYRRSWR